MREGSSTSTPARPQGRPDKAEPSDRTDPLAFAINVTARHSDIEITLCSFVAVEQLIRVTSLVRVQSRPDVRLASIPALILSSRSGVSMIPVSAHVLPQGAMAWVSWLFERPAKILDDYEGRIERLDLDFLIGKRAPLAQPGPWLFSFSLTQAAASSVTVGAPPV